MGLVAVVRAAERAARHAPASSSCPRLLTACIARPSRSTSLCCDDSELLSSSPPPAASAAPWK